MDERKQQLKQLKKEYKKQRLKALWHWNLMWYLLVILLVLSAGCVYYLFIYRNMPLSVADGMVLLPVKLALLALLVLVGCLRGGAIRKTKKFDSYLDYKTLKNALKTEKQEDKR